LALVLAAPTFAAVLLAAGQVAPANSGLGFIEVSQAVEYSHFLKSAAGPPDAYARTVAAIFGGAKSEVFKIVAYEENESFVYAVAKAHSEDAARMRIRRFIALNASILLIEDEVPGPTSQALSPAGLISADAPNVSHQVAKFDDAGETAEILYPLNAQYVTRPGASAKQRYMVEVQPPADDHVSRFLQVIHSDGSGPQDPSLHYELSAKSSDWKFTATVGGKTFNLILPPPSEDAGDISISDAGGKTLVATRPFPSGILPHGPEGDRLLDVWDSEYRRPQPALWDIGRPADELQKFVSSGKVAACRVVDMCCGSGTDAIYLASKGFDVTAIDVSPSALGLAMAKARKAGVSVHWMVGDILAPPDVKPFDFVYDRGCYHVVRDQNLNAYLETVRRFSQPGTPFLLIATRRDESSSDVGTGVTEEELRFDFLPLFNVEWLRQITMESTSPGNSPPGWCALMKRKSAP
jgi:hypothetical protein